MKHTEAERMAWRARIKGICQKIKDMPDTERQAMAARLGTTTPEGHTLSDYNTCLLWMQAGKALAMVAGFRQWQRAGRSVKKGETNARTERGS